MYAKEACLQKVLNQVAFLLVLQEGHPMFHLRRTQSKNERQVVNLYLQAACRVDNVYIYVYSALERNVSSVHHK